MLTYFHDTNDMFIMCDGLDKLGGPTSVTGIAVKVFVVFFSDFAHCELSMHRDRVSACIFTAGCCEVL